MDLPPTPLKDCPSCTRRRIRCDRGQPHCQKCTKKGLACPGYAPRVRWAGGAAIRGHLKGLQSQALQSPSVPSPEISSLEDAEPWISSSISGFSLQGLIDYYAEHVAKYMVWIDTPDNLFRQHIIPLAQNHRVVRLALIAVSAQHATRSRGDDRVLESTRNEAVSMIRKYINDMAYRLTDGHDIDSCDAEWLLASMIVLWSYEMAHSGAVAADFHRKAARSLINTVTITRAHQSPLFSLLKNKFCTYDVFASTTSFDVDNVREVILPPCENETQVFNETALFSCYQSLLHEVTLLARVGEETPVRDWVGDFSLARGTTLMAAGQLSIKSAEKRRDLIRLVDIHYDAALLYVAACLGSEAHQDTEAAISDLLAKVQALEEMDQCLQNLPWPVFIAGTASYENEERQAVIVDVYRTIFEVTGFRQYETVLEFLQVFWAGGESDWQVLAREWELSGRQLLPY
ncbi:hypothetical protein ACJ41O_005539 [Fusarium nematophilum]